MSLILVPAANLSYSEATTEYLTPYGGGGSIHPEPWSSNRTGPICGASLCSHHMTIHCSLWWLICPQGLSLPLLIWNPGMPRTPYGPTSHLEVCVPPFLKLQWPTITKQIVFPLQIHIHLKPHQEIHFSTKKNVSKNGIKQDHR